MIPGKFKEWIRRQLFDTRREGRCVKIAVRHVSASKTSLGEVDSVSVPTGSDLEESFIEQAAIRLWESAQQDADGLTGVQSYAAIGFFEEEPTKSLTRYAFRMASQDEEDGSEDPSNSEPATKTGLMSQLMRHSEAFARISSQSSLQIINTLQRQMAAKDEIIEKMTKDAMENMRIREDLLSQKHERDLVNAREAQNFELQQEAIQQFKPFIPILLNKLSGGKFMLPSGQENGLTKAFQSFFDTVSPEQIDTLQNVLKPNQLALLGELMNSVQASMQSNGEDKH